MNDLFWPILAGMLVYLPAVIFMWRSVVFNREVVRLLPIIYDRLLLPIGVMLMGALFAVLAAHMVLIHRKLASKWNRLEVKL